MPTDYSASIAKVFGTQGAAPEQDTPVLPDAVDTTGGIAAALDAQPGMLEQQARQQLTPPPAAQPQASAPEPEIDYDTDPTAGRLPSPEERRILTSTTPGPDWSAGHDDGLRLDTLGVRALMADRELTRHELLPEGSLDDASGGMLRASFMLNNARRHSADDAFAAAAAGAALGMPLDMTLASLPKAKELLAEFTPTKVRDFAPGFLRQVQWDYDAAMLWGHDLEAANKLAGAFEPQHEPEVAPDSWQAALGRGMANVGDMAAQLVINLARLGVEGAGALAVAGTESGRPIGEGNFTPSANSLSQYLFAASEEWKRALDALTEQAKERNADSPLAGLSVWDNPGVLLDPRWWLENTPGAVASLVPVMGGYLTAGRAGAGLAGLMLNSNELYTTLLQSGLPDDARTRLYSLVGGIGMSALDVLGLEGIFGGRAAVKSGIAKGALEPSLEAAARGGWKQGLRWTAGRAGAAFLSEGGTEWLQNLTKTGFQAAAEGKDVAGIVSAIGAAATELEDFILGGVVGGGIGAAHARGQLAQARDGVSLTARIRELLSAMRAEIAPYSERAALAQSLDQAVEAADNSSLRKAAPEVFEREAAKLIPENSRQLWLGPDDAATLFQEASTPEAQAELAAALGTTPEAVQDAVEKGAPLPVDTAAVLARTEGEQRQKILDGLRATPDGVSGREAAQYDPAQRLNDATTRLRQEEGEADPTTPEGAMSTAKSAQQRTADVNREVTRITSEIEATGAPRHVAETYAQLFAQHALALQSAYRIPADALLRRLSVNASRQAAPQGDNALFHAMYPAPEKDILSFMRRARGEDPKEKASYFVLPLEGDLSDVHFRVTRDMARHQMNDHPDMPIEDNAVLPTLLSRISGANTIATGKMGTYGKRHIGMQEIHGKTYGYIFDIGTNGNVTLTTFFNDNPKKVKNWFAGIQKKASKVRVDGPPNGSPVHDSRVPLGKPSLADSLRQMVDEVKAAPLFQFIGERGAARLDAAEEATTRLDNLSVARAMETAGRDAKAVKLATGWERGADGKWRYELDDSGIRISRDGDMLLAAQDTEYARYAALTERLFNGAQGELTEQESAELDELEQRHMDTALALRKKVNSNQATLADVLDAPEIFAAYPFLRDVKLVFVDNPGYRGAYEPDAKTILLRKERYWNERKDVLLHEIQHAIQFAEGFAEGGTPGMFTRQEDGGVDIGPATAKNYYKKADAILAKASPELSGKILAINRALAAEDYNTADALQAQLTPEEEKLYWQYATALSEAQERRKRGHTVVTPTDAYRSLAGEAEARNTSARMRMTAAERLASLATETEDVAREDQIILREGLEAGAAMAASASDVVAHITPESAAAMGLPHEGDFIARESDLAPIDQKHGEQFRSMGFANAREFVNHVMGQVEAVYKGNSTPAYLFVRKIQTKVGLVVAEFEAQYENGRYRVTTAHPVREDYFKNKQPLWERAQSNHSASGTPGAVSGQSGVGNNIPDAAPNGNPLFQLSSPRNAAASLDAVRRQYEGTEQWMKAPNGEPTNLNERQWLQVRTPEFKAWFGDWENDPANASKILDANGEPLVVYHVTDAQFDTFERAKARQDSDIPAFFFSSGTSDWGDMGGRVVPAFLNIRNPREGKPNVRMNGSEMLAELEKQGFDGTIEREEDMETEFAAFSPTQIKHAEDNSGDFSSSNPNILYQLAYHGTPHRFDQFTLDHIGEGEGAQAHGWGLYFAGNREVSEGYRKKLTARNVSLSGITPKFLFIDGRHLFTDNEEQALTELVNGAFQFNGIYNTTDDLKEEIKEYEKTLFSDLKILKRQISNPTDEDIEQAELIGIDYREYNKEFIEDIRRNLKYMEMIRERLVKFSGERITRDEKNLQSTGQLFEVDIPENDVLLDEQKPFSEQPQIVQAAMREAYGLDSAPFWKRAIGYLTRASALKLTRPKSLESKTGVEFYHELARALGKKGHENPKAASLWLNDHGVKGITYEGFQDGRCFVVFDDAAVSVLETYYQEQNAAHPLGSISLTPENAAITIFEGANLSTIPHEAGHFFLDNLLRIARDDGSLALEYLRNELQSISQGVPPDMAAELTALLREAEQAAPDARMEALHNMRGRLLEAVRDAKEEREAVTRQAAAQREAAKQEGRQQDYEGTAEQPADWQQSEMRGVALDARIRVMNRAATAARNALDALRGLEQARADARTLREWAQVPLEGELLPGTEDYVKLHEAVARGFEQYLMEGKAPSKKLEGVFSRLRAWLCQVYRHARDVLGLPISDDVRRVFDRLLASDAQLRQSRKLQHVFAAERDFARRYAPSADVWQEWADMLSQAEAEVQAAMDRATLRQRNKRWKAYYADAMDALNNDPWWQMVDDLSHRRKDADGHSFGGLDRQSLRAFLTEEQVAELSRVRPGLVNAQGFGLPVDTAAQENGFEGGDELATALYDRLVTYGENKKKLASGMADTQLAAEDAQAEQEAESGAVLAEADAYGAYLDRMDEAVLRMAARRGYRTQEEQDRFVRNSITPRQLIKQRAFDVIRHATLREITPARYQAMLDKALRERSRALVDGDVMAAVRAVDNARLANELIWSAQYQRSQLDALLKLAAQTAQAKPGTFPTLHREALRRVLQSYGLANMRGAPDADMARHSLRELVTQAMSGNEDWDFAPAFPDWLLDGVTPNTGAKGGSYLDLTPAQLLDVENLIKFLRKKGYDERTDARNSEAAKIRMDADSAAGAMAAVPDLRLSEAGTLRRRAQDMMRRWYSAIDSLRWQMRKADGFARLMGEGEAGAMEANLQKVIDGETGKRQRTEQLAAMLAPHLRQLSQWARRIEQENGKHLEKLRDADGRPVLLPEAMRRAYGDHWTADNVLAMALNCGNASNMARLTRGLALDYETLAVLLGDEMAARILSADAERAVPVQGRRQGLLTVADWQAVQGVWDAVGSLWADTQAVHERMFGFRPQGVEPSALRITDAATGQVVSLRGGYYPVRYDGRIDEKVANWNEKDEILSRNESLMAVPAARRGHTQARAEQAPGLPLRLDTGVLLEHLEDATSLIYLGEITRHLDRVTRDPAFQRQYIRAYGREDYDAIRPNLRGLVRKEPPPRNDLLVSAANFWRRYLVPWGLSFNLKVAALQMTAIFPGMGDIGAAPVLRGMAWTTRHGLAGLRQIWEASPYMKSRSDNLDQDLRREIAGFDPTRRPRTVRVGNREFGWDDLVHAGMTPIVAVDMLATSAVWIGAYNTRLRQLQGSAVKYGVHTDSQFHKEAVDYADNVVKQSNPDYDPSSRSGFLRANNSYRLASTFMSAVTLFGARHRFMYTARAKGRVTLGRLARFEAYETVLPAVSMFLFLGLVRGIVQGAFGGDDEEKDELKKLALSTFLDQATLRLPLLGNAFSAAVMDVFGYGDDGRSSGGLRTALDEPVRQFSNLFTRGSRALHRDLSDEQAQALVYAAADLASFFARVPVSKLVRNAQRGYDQWQRGEGTPLSMVIPRPGK